MCGKKEMEKEKVKVMGVMMKWVSVIGGGSLLVGCVRGGGIRGSWGSCG